jgi:sulfofructose kinase
VRIPFDLAAVGSRPFDVVGLGQNSVDLLAVVDEFPATNSKHRIQRFARLPGGQVASAMVCCARLGWRARYVGRFGSDEWGRLGLDSLKRDGVDVAAAEVVPGVGNHFAIILVDGRTAERTVLWDRPSAMTLRAHDVTPDVITSARVLLVDCQDLEASTRAAQLARNGGVLTVVDVEALLPKVPQLLRHIDIIIASEGFPEALTGYADTGQALAALSLEFQPVVACVTLGPQGSLAVCQGQEIRTRAFEVPTVDTTGAGDAFRGGFISGYLTLGPDGALADILTYANAVAALKCRSLGARDGLPRAPEVSSLVSQRTS